MGNGYVETGVRRTTRNLLIANLVLLIGVLTVALLNGRYLYNYVLGPFPMDREALLSLKDPDTLQKHWVTIQADRVTDTGVDAIHETTYKGNTTRSLIGRYVLVSFGSRVLLVKAPTGYTGTAFTGALQRVIDDEESLVSKGLLAEVPGQSGVLPFMMDATDTHEAAVVWLQIGIVLAGLALLNLWKVVRRTANPEVHPLYRTLSAYGPAATVVASVDTEVEGGGALRFGGASHAILTPHWLLVPSTFGVQAVHLDNLVWVYEQVTRRKNGLSYSIVLWTDKGIHTQIHDVGIVVADILRHVQEHAPWAQVGKTPELEKALRTNRQAMVQKVADLQRDKTGWSQQRS